MEPPEELPIARPYLLTLYIDIGNEIVSPPPFEYFPGTRALLHGSTEVLREDWRAVDRSLARILNGVIAGARAGRVRSERPVEAIIYSWPLVASWAVPLVFVVGIAIRRNAKSSRRPPRAALA